MKENTLNEYNGMRIGDYIKTIEKHYPLLLTKIEDYGNGYPIFECNNNKLLRMYAKFCEKWNPKINEYCFFKKEKENVPLVAKFKKQINDKFIAIVSDGKGNINEIEFNYCEPFIPIL